MISSLKRIRLKKIQYGCIIGLVVGIIGGLLFLRTNIEPTVLCFLVVLIISLRTTEKGHIRAVQKALQIMYQKRDIYKGKYEGLYCQGCEQYKNEKDLVKGECPDHKTKPGKMSEECYMFKLSKYQDKLLEKIKSDELKILPAERKNEVINFYEQAGLKDIAFSRKNVKWGIPLPWDKTHTAYVWADALLNYLTGLGWQGEADKAPDMWPADVHLMSKDILRVHATIWPAMLLSLELPLPKQIFVHGFFLVDGQKMSKSLGNVIRPEELVKKYGVDATRYLLMSATPFGHDGNISWDKFDEKYNADLANGLGNLVARVLTMTEKYFDGKVPPREKEEEVKISPKHVFKLHPQGEQWEVRLFINGGAGSYKSKLDNKRLKIDQSLSEAMHLVAGIDKYISDYKPFKLIKEDKEKTAAVLYNCLESLRNIAWMLWPFIPETAERIWQNLGLDPSKEMEKDFKKAIKWGGLEPGTKVKKSEPLFPRV